MSLVSSYALREGYLYVHTTGMTPADLDESLGYIDELVSTAERHGHPPILLDRREVVQNPAAAAASDLLLDYTADRFLEHGYLRPSEAPGSQWRHRPIAILVPAEHLANVLQAEALFYARGVSVHYFSDEGEAATWLREQAS
jgi:hypothetical protein